MAKTNFEKPVERRQARRILLEIFATIQKGSKKEECYIQNISQGGALVYVAMDLVDGDDIRLQFQIGQKKYDIEGIVRNVRKFSEKRKYILKIGKSLDFESSMNIAFNEPMDLSSFQFLQLHI